MDDSRELMMEFIRATHRYGKLNANLHFRFAGELTKVEFFCLGAIRSRCGRGPEGPGVSVWELAEKMRVRPPAISRMLRTLERRGLIQRSVVREDRRSICVDLTESGRQIWEHATEELDEFARQVTAQMGAEELRTLTALIGRMSDVVEAIQAKESDPC